MSLARQLIVLLLSLLSVLTLGQASVLSIQRYLTQPSSHPALIQQAAATVPTEVTIPHQPIALPLVPTAVSNGEWSVISNGISLLENTGTADKGYILYGHNWNSLLGRLHQAKLGEEVVLTYPDGRREVYRIQTRFTVPASRLDVLALAKPQTLLIYTCTGFLDTQRLVVVAERLELDLSYITK